MKIKIDSFNKVVDFYFHIPTKQEGWKGKDLARIVSWVFGGAVIGGIAWLLGHGAAGIKDLFGRVTKGPVPRCPIPEKMLAKTLEGADPTTAPIVPISKLPDEVLAKILKSADSSTLGSALLTSKAFNRAATKVIAERARDVAIAFGAAQWKEFMGADIGVEPPLPVEIRDILAETCPFSTDGKTVAETHLLMLIPETINGQPLNLNTLGKLFKAKFPTVGDDTGYRWIRNEIQNNTRNQSKSRWVLLTRDVIEGSRNIAFEDQQALVAEKGHNKYKVPFVLDATACILLEYARSMGRTRLYSDRPWTYSRCQENILENQLIVGGFASAGLFVNRNRIYGNDCIGVAAMRIFA